MTLNTSKVQKLLDQLKAEKKTTSISPKVLSKLLEELLELREKTAGALDVADYSYEGLVALIEANTANSEEVAQAIKEYVMDSANPRENRVYLWTNTPERMAPREAYVCGLGFNDIDPNFTFYDNLNVERHETVDLRTVFDRSYFNDYIKSKFVLKQDLWNQFVDACMADGFFVVTHDW